MKLAADGLSSWSTPEVIVPAGSLPSGEVPYYPTLLNTNGGDPQVLGQSFTVFYSDPFNGWPNVTLYATQIGVSGGSGCPIGAQVSGLQRGTVMQ